MLGGMIDIQRGICISCSREARAPDRLRCPACQLSWDIRAAAHLREQEE
jgi:hypothetical protein